MRRTGASFLLLFQISGFTERLQWAEFGIWLLWHKGAFLFLPVQTPAIEICAYPRIHPSGSSCHVSRLSAYKRPTTLGRNLASPKACELNHKGTYLSSSSHMGKLAQAPFLSSPSSFGSWKGNEQALLPLSWVLLEAVLLKNKLVMCVRVIPGPWKIAETIRNSAGSLILTWQPQNNFHCLIIRQKIQPCLPPLQSCSGWL